jgi:hypothetical protein
MVQWERVFAIKLDSLNLIPRIHIMVRTNTGKLAPDLHIYTNTQINKQRLKNFLTTFTHYFRIVNVTVKLLKFPFRKKIWCLKPRLGYSMLKYMELLFKIYLVLKLCVCVCVSVCLSVCLSICVFYAGTCVPVCNNCRGQKHQIL